MADTLPEGDAKVEAVRSMFDAIAPRYDLVNRIMTFRMDVRWRRRTVAALALPAGSRVLDLACGTGDLCRELTRQGHIPAGVDLSGGMLRAARTTAPLVHGDILRLPMPDGSVDGATCGFALRNLVELPRFFTELARVVRPGGRIGLLEVAEPRNRFLRWGHAVYFGKVVPRIGGLLSDPAAYRYLPKSVAYLPPPDRMMAMLRDAGFADATRTLLSAGIAQLVIATPERAMTLVARTRRVDREVDLLAFAGRNGVVWERLRAGVAGRGVAARVPVDTVASTLAAIETDDEVGYAGCGPVAFGALPFRPDPGTTLVIPAEIAGRADDGTRWLTTIGDPDAQAPALTAGDEPLAPPTSFAVAPSQPAAWWCDQVAAATKAMAGGAFEKVVLAREVVVTADRPIDPATVLSRLRATYPGCVLFSISGLIGASPELLVARHGDMVRSHPMAGTAPRGGDPTADARLAAGLLASVKDRHEHQITIDMVHDTLLPWCSYLDYEAEPSIVAVANVQHLATLVEGRLSAPPPSVLELVQALHPTPAVAGWPREEALAFMAAHEQLDRRRYAGAVGWVDAGGNGSWAVALRCAELSGVTARLFAGNGIVVDSDPATELAETQGKLQAMLSAIVRV